MKILHISKDDLSGGAGRAACRLHESLLKTNVESWILCQNKISDNRFVIGPVTKFSKAFSIFRGFLDRIPSTLYRKRKTNLFYPQWLPGAGIDTINNISPDIINLHWICGGFFSIESLAKIKRPIVWTLHDMWPFTGGCHYTGECLKYTESCGNCPQLGSRKSQDLSHWIWKRKLKIFNRLDLKIVSPSHWLADCAQKSSLLKNMDIRIIPYCIDLIKYRMFNKIESRKLLNLPEDCNLILISDLGNETEKRKGMNHLYAVLKSLNDLKAVEKIEIVVLGSSEPEDQLDVGLKCHYMGRLHDDISLSLVYSACDCFLFTSTEDNLPNMIIESMACGTPCIAFDTGGIPDMLDHKTNGYLVTPFDKNGLVEGIIWTFKNRERLMDLSKNARAKVENKYSQETIAKKYISIYNE